MQLFPYVLCRISGDDFDRFSDFVQNKELDECFAAWHEASKLKNDFKLRISDLLRKYNESLTDAKAQNEIQNFRRNVYNDRPVRQAQWINIAQLVPPQIADELNAYRVVVERSSRLKQDAEHAYRRAIERGRTHIKDLIRRDSLKNGLLLASSSLYQQLSRYIATATSGFGKRELQIEASLLQYISRIFTKTSPLSTFTNLAMGTVDAVPSKTPIVFSPGNGSGTPVTSHIRLNNSLFYHLKVLLCLYKPAARQLPVKVNPTVVRSHTHFHFLFNSQNIESFQQLKVNPVIEKIVDLLQTGTCLFGALVNAVIESVQATEEELEKYIRQLISYGLLEFDFGISGLDPGWDGKLAGLLQTWPEDSGSCFQELILGLHQLQQLKHQYSAAADRRRKEILDQGHEIFNAMYLRLHEAAELPLAERQAMVAGTVSPNTAQQEAPYIPTSFTHIESTSFSMRRESLFYEDTVRNLEFVMDSQQISECVEKIDRLMRCAAALGIYETEQDRMKKFFRQKYATGKAVPLLEFYKDYYAEVKKPSLEKKRSVSDTSAPQMAQEEAAIDAERFKRASGYAQRLADLMMAQPHHAEVRLDKIMLEKSLLTSEPAWAGGSNAFGAFLQFYCDKQDGKFKAVVNRTFPGYGKMLSRFLHLFDEKVVDAVRTWNEKLAAPHELFIENCDASFYNANIHPCLLEHEIRLPGSHNSLPEENQLNVSQFEVVCSQPDSIAIYHRPSGKRSYFFDLAFQASAGRSNLFQLLQAFTKAEYLHVNPICYVINDVTKKAAPPDPEIQVIPRIVYEDTIVIQRKSWIIPKTHLPFKSKSEADADYYIRLNTWRLDYNMPDEVFVIARQRSERGAAQKTKDDYKPQYINLKDPFFVRMFGKLLDKVAVQLLVQEMLPASDQLLRVNGRRHVSEFVVQWYGFRQ